MARHASHDDTAGDVNADIGFVVGPTGGSGLGAALPPPHGLTLLSGPTRALELSPKIQGHANNNQQKGKHTMNNSKQQESKKWNLVNTT